MTAAQFELLEATQAEELLRARFETLVWHGCPPGNALVIASHMEVELLDAVTLLMEGCPAHLVLPILV
jgi:ketol-acid reductoisomerase